MLNKFKGWLHSEEETRPVPPWKLTANKLNQVLQEGKDGRGKQLTSIDVGRISEAIKGAEDELSKEGSVSEETAEGLDLLLEDYNEDLLD